MSRIITGQVAGRRLAPVKGEQTRPTTDRVKEALFSRLESWDVIAGARVLDLFAGSGALGLEAASRGAATVTFVDKSPVAFAALSTNVDALAPDLQTTLSRHRQSAATFLSGVQPEVFDLVLVDPPYDFTDEQINELLPAIARALAPDGVIMIERGKRSTQPAWPEPLSGLKPRNYGETVLYFAERPLT